MMVDLFGPNGFLKWPVGLTGMFPLFQIIPLFCLLPGVLLPVGVPECEPTPRNPFPSDPCALPDGRESWDIWSKFYAV